MKLSNGLTKEFVANQGVEQGCILSPLLFNIFFIRSPKPSKKKECNSLLIENSTPIDCIIWEDDIVILSESEEGLQRMLDNLALYARTNGMEINTDKTKIMIFNKTGKFFRRTFNFYNKNIFTTNSYKYLGFIITSSGEITSGLKDLKDRALRAYFKLKSSMGHYFRLYPEVTITLFAALLKPILLYASDFWGCLKMPTNNPIENTHMRFCKDLLDVQRQTTNIGVLLDLGRVPIMLYGRKNCIKNWCRIHVLGRADDLVSTHNVLIGNGLKWNQAVINCLNNMGIGWLSGTENVHEKAMTRMADIFHQEAFANLAKTSSKLRTYGKIKTDIGIERYLYHIPNVETRIAVSRLRLSNHQLMIEKGRHLKLDVSQRICPF